MKDRLPLNKNQIALVHVAKAALGLSEGEYRDVLRSFGAASSKELTQGQMDELLAHFARLGFVSTGKPKGAPAKRPARSKQLYLAAVETALAALNKPWAYAEGIARQMFGVKKLEWLSPDQIHRVHVALIYKQRREAEAQPDEKEAAP